MNNAALNMTKVLRTYGIRGDEVACYIAVGRSKVLNDKLFDPYGKLPSKTKQTAAIAEDALSIARWFNRNRKNWTDEQLNTTHDGIVFIQRGPAWYYKELFRTQLSGVDFDAAQSWAQREQHTPDSVDMNLNPDLRERVLSVVRVTAKLKQPQFVQRDLKRILALAFFNKTIAGDFDL